MTERYDLSTNTVPTIPVPHDCVIKEIGFDDEFLVLKFEDDIEYHDSIKSIHPDASSLTMRIHLYDTIFDAYEHRMKDKLSGEGYYLINNKKLSALCKKTVEYLYHYVGYQSIIIKLYCGGYYMLDITSDYIEFDWVE